MVQDDEYTAQVNRAFRLPVEFGVKHYTNSIPEYTKNGIQNYRESEWSNVYQFDNRKWTQSEKDHSVDPTVRQYIKIDKKYAGSKQHSDQMSC